MTRTAGGFDWEVLLISLAGLLGAGLWAQLVEGSSRLRQPFGFYGGLIGVGIACLFFENRWTLLAANCLGAPWSTAAVTDARPLTPSASG